MISQTQETSDTVTTADDARSTPLSSYLGLAIIAAIALVMIILQTAGAQDLIQ